MANPRVTESAEGLVVFLDPAGAEEYARAIQEWVAGGMVGDRPEPPTP